MSEWGEIIVRSLVFIGVLILMTKILGKKQISEISFFEYVSGITIGSIAGEVIMGLESSIAHGVLAIAIFSVVTLIVDVISLKSKKFRDTVNGRGTILIKDGKIMEDNLKKEKYSLDELASLLRQKNIFNIADVEFAVLEATGDISAMLKKEHQPLTPKDINLFVPNEKQTQTIVMDGEIINDAMTESGKNRKWLNHELDKLGVTLDNVFLAQVNSYGELYVDIYDDKLTVSSPQQRPLLLAMMKKCQADLELFALETEIENAKALYNKNAKKLNKVIETLEPFLK